MENYDQARPCSPIQRHSLENSHKALQDPQPRSRDQWLPAAEETAEMQLTEDRHLIHQGVPVLPDLDLQWGLPGRERATEEEQQLPKVEVDIGPGPAGEGMHGPHKPKAQHGVVGRWWRVWEGEV